jgi:hypothetical protein
MYDGALSEDYNRNPSRRLFAIVGIILPLPFAKDELKKMRYVLNVSCFNNVIYPLTLLQYIPCFIELLQQTQN